MKNKVIKIGFLFAVMISAGVFTSGTIKANGFENTAESNFVQAFKGCKVTKSGGTSIYVAASDKDYVLKRGTYLRVVDPEPHQGIIVVKTRINKKMTRGEIKLDDTNCVPILPH